MRFFVLKPEGRMFGKLWTYADIIDPFNVGEPKLCPQCSGPISRLRWQKPHKITLSSFEPEKFGDFLWGAGFPLMVSGTLKDCYSVSKLSGIEQFHEAAEIVNLPKDQRAGANRSISYHLIDYKWGGANIDDNLTDVVRKKSNCDYCKGDIKCISNIVIEEGSWDGSDIFEARGLSGVILISENFKNMVRKCALKNFVLVRLEDYSYSYLQN